GGRRGRSRLFRRRRLRGFGREDDEVRRGRGGHHEIRILIRRGADRLPPGRRRGRDDLDWRGPARGRGGAGRGLHILGREGAIQRQLARLLRIRIGGGGVQGSGGHVARVVLERHAVEQTRVHDERVALGVA